VLSKIHGLKADKLSGNGRTVHNDELHNSTSFVNAAV